MNVTMLIVAPVIAVLVAFTMTERGNSADNKKQPILSLIRKTLKWIFSIFTILLLSLCGLTIFYAHVDGKPFPLSVLVGIVPSVIFLSILWLWPIYAKRNSKN
jgi:chromate transport protein ChrA